VGHAEDAEHRKRFEEGQGVGIKRREARESEGRDMESGIPVPTCRHGAEVFVNAELGELDENHIYCVRCKKIVCLNWRDPYRKTGRCECGSYMSETHKKQDDGIGTVRWVELINGRAVNGGSS